MTTMKDGFPFVPYHGDTLPPDVAAENGRQFYESMAKRRSVRDFAETPVPRSKIERAILTAGTAPSGANQQPWTFVAVSSASLKSQIREAAEKEEKAFYDGRGSEEWRRALAPLGTDWRKPFLETAPWLVVVFAQTYGLPADGGQRKHYYVKESVGLACGLFVASLHSMGLATLTHTPSPMGFLSELLGRPENEKPYILFPVGYPAASAMVPDIARKGLDETSVWM